MAESSLFLSGMLQRPARELLRRSVVPPGEKTKKASHVQAWSEAEAALIKQWLRLHRSLLVIRQKGKILIFVSNSLSGGGPSILGRVESC